MRGSRRMSKCEEGIVWYNVKRITLAVVLEVGGVTVEDADWLQKEDNSTHIDVTELEANIRGINLGLKWRLQLCDCLFHF